jgi:hypothetical protein
MIYSRAERHTKYKTYPEKKSEDHLQTGCTSIFTISLYIYLYNVFSQHVAVVYNHHQVVIAFTLTPVFLLILPTLPNVYIWRQDVIALYDKINWNINLQWPKSIYM